jgi:hypothetical protein
MSALPPAHATVRIMSDVEIAFRRLHRAIVWPTRNDTKLLDFAQRSVDFGKEGHVPTIARGGGLLHAVRNSLWREGSIAEVALPILRLPLLAILEAIFVARWSFHSFIRLLSKS